MLDLNDFIDKLNWGLNKEELKAVLKKAIKRQLLFEKPKTDYF